MPHSGQPALRRTLKGYYVATALFLGLDLGLGLNFRIAFLDAHDGWRLLYYGVCFGCLAVLVVRPAWTLAVSAVESLATMVALILSVALRSIAIDVDAVIDGTAAVLSVQEIVNFVISGSVAWLSWTRSIEALAGRDQGH